MLAHQLRALPAFDHFWAEVPRIFAWLNGTEVDEELEHWPIAEGEEFWTPPPTFWTGLGSCLEPVRFAAVNRLLVNLGYLGRHRLIEPYSLRRTRDGHILLHTIRADEGGHRAYRIDRIQSVDVTNHPFTPRYLIEFPVSGTVPAPATQRREVTRSPSVRHSPRMRSANRRRYVVRCPVCRKLFRRVQRDTRLRLIRIPAACGIAQVGQVTWRESNDLQLSPREMDYTPLGLGTPLAIGTRATAQRRPVPGAPSGGQHMWKTLVGWGPYVAFPES